MEVSTPLHAAKSWRPSSRDGQTTICSRTTSPKRKNSAACSHGSSARRTTASRRQGVPFPSLYSKANPPSQLQQILTYRNDETSQRIDGSIARQATALHDLARAAARDSEALASLGRRAQRDSRTVKVLTIVAAMYLPAALVATVFSSNLVQSVSSGEGAATAEHFQLASQFWQFPVVTLLLTVLTLGPVLAWTYFHNDEAVAAKVAP